MVENPQPQEQERPETRPESAPKLPFRQRAMGLIGRFKGAWEKATKEKDKKLTDRVVIFFAEFFKETGGLTVEQEQVDKQECTKIGEILKVADPKAIVDATKQEVFGQNLGQLNKDETEVVDGFFTVGAETFKNELDDNEETEVARTLDVLKGKESSEFLTNERKLLLAYYGVKTSKGLKLQFKQKGLGIDDIEKQLNTFENAMKKGQIQGRNFKALLDISYNPLDKNSIFALLAALPEPTRPLLGGLSSTNWGDKVSTRPTLEKLLPATKANPQAMSEITDIIVNVKLGDRIPTNREIATLLYHIEVSDFDYLANLVHA